MPKQTRTMVLTEPRKFALVERPVPVPAAGEALVRIASTAVCHTDLDIYTGGPKNLRYPIVLGHESTGTIESVDASASGLAPGQAEAHQVGRDDVEARGQRRQDGAEVGQRAGARPRAVQQEQGLPLAAAPVVDRRSLEGQVELAESGDRGAGAHRAAPFASSAALPAISPRMAVTSRWTLP